MSKQDRQGVRTASDLEQKYDFNKRFAELMGIATDARDKVEKAESTLRDEMLEQYTRIYRDIEQIVLEAGKDFVKTGDFETYKQSVHSQFQVMADSISATVAENEERISEVRDQLDEQLSILDKYMKESEAALVVRADQISAKVTSNEERITEVANTVTGQVTAFEEYKRSNNAALVVMDNEISANLTSTEQKIKEVRDELTGQVESFEEYKKTAEGDFAVMSDQISMNLTSTLEQISSVQSGLDDVNDELSEQARNVEILREEKASELKLLNDRMEVNFESTTEQISNVDGQMQSIKEELEKHFEFSTDGLIIKAGEGAMQLLLDNDVIRFMKDGQEFGWWDGVNFHTGNIYVDVDEVAQFGNYGFIPYEDSEADGLDLVRVGG